MEVPRDWRLNRKRLLFEGSVCPFCGEPHFPSREGGVCPECGRRMDGQAVEKRDALGVGALLLTQLDDGLYLLLFRKVLDTVLDPDSQKKERAYFPGQKQGRFEEVRGANTVTGKVDADIPLVESDEPEFSQFIQQILLELQREVREEAAVSIPTQDFRLLMKSPLMIEQFRGTKNERGEDILYRFVVYAFAAIVSGETVDEIIAESGREVLLIPVDQEKLSQSLNSLEIRSATRAILNLLTTYLLFLGDEVQEEPAEVLVENKRGDQK